MMQLKVLLKVKLGRNKSWKSCMENNGKVGLFCVVLLAIFPLHQTHQIGDWILKMCKPCREYLSLSPLSLSRSLSIFLLLVPYLLLSYLSSWQRSC